MNCDAIHQTNTSNMPTPKTMEEDRQEATISTVAADADLAAADLTVAAAENEETADQKSECSSSTSSRCGRGEEEKEEEPVDDEADDEGPGQVPQKMGLVRFMELNNNDSKTTTRQNNKNNKSDSDNDTSDDDDEEESIDIFNMDSSIDVLSPLAAKKYTLQTSADEMLKKLAAKNLLYSSNIDTTEHTHAESVTEASSCSLTDLNILDEPLEEPSLISSWHCIRSRAAAASAAASAAVLAATAAAPVVPLRVASDDRLEPQDEQDEQDDDADYYRVQLKDLKRHCVLGEGFLGKVWLVSDSTITCKQQHDHQQLQHDNNNNCYALKRLSKCDLMNEDLIDSVIRERDLLREMFHPGIVKLVASYQDANYVYLLQDYCPGGELFSLLANHGTTQNGQEANDDNSVVLFTEDACRFYTACLTDALWYMHVRKMVVYRDLKPENVMLDRLGYPILVDFGHARKLLPVHNNNHSNSSSSSSSSSEDDGSDNHAQQDEQQEPAKAYTLCGTPKFVAPEMIQGCGHGFAVDYWSLGIILYQMLSMSSSSSSSDNHHQQQHHPFQYDENMDDFALYESIVQDDYMPLNSNVVSPDAADLVDGLLKKDPNERLGAVNESMTHNGVLEHPFIANSSKINIGLLRRRLIPAPWVPRLAGSLDASHFDDFGNGSDHDNNAHHHHHQNHHYHHLGNSSLHLSLRDQEKFANF